EGTLGEAVERLRREVGGDLERRGAGAFVPRLDDVEDLVPRRRVPERLPALAEVPLHLAEGAFGEAIARGEAVGEGALDLIAREVAGFYPLALEVRIDLPLEPEGALARGLAVVGRHHILPVRRWLGLQNQMVQGSGRSREARIRARAG